MPRLDAQLDGKVGLVTAGATGIGFGCARALVAAGARVVICARRVATLEKAAAELGESAAWVACDVRDDASVDAAVAYAVERFGRLDMAVNSAGVGSVGSVLELSPEHFQTTVDTNLVGVFRCLRAEARAMREAGGGAIVNVSSIAGTLPHPWMSAYCASKAGLDMLTRCAADELGEHGIRVNAVQPGVVETPLAALLASNPTSRAEYLRLMPISRIGRPEDVATLVRFLLSEDASWITGQVIGVNGGHDLRQGPNLVPMFRELGLR